MPYILQEDRSRAEMIPSTVGELNYAITKLILDYYKLKNNYQQINDIMGALEGAKMEFYRKVVVPYENQKCYDNGDVYP